LLCDAAVVAVSEDFRGNVLDVGRRRRTIPTTLRLALRLRDRGCRFPGCTNRFVDGHHILPWSKGGPTTLANLCSLCRRHHTYVREGGIRIVADGAGGFAFVRSDGRPIVATPVQGSFERLRAQNPDGIGASTNLPRGAGGSADIGVAVWTLMPVATA
jgi:hypothetical protein